MAAMDMQPGDAGQDTEGSTGHVVLGEYDDTGNEGEGFKVVNIARSDDTKVTQRKTMKNRDLVPPARYNSYPYRNLMCIVFFSMPICVLIVVIVKVAKYDKPSVNVTNQTLQSAEELSEITNLWYQNTNVLMQQAPTKPAYICAVTSKDDTPVQGVAAEEIPAQMARCLLHLLTCTPEVNTTQTHRSTVTFSTKGQQGTQEPFNKKIARIIGPIWKTLQGEWEEEGEHDTTLNDTIRPMYQLNILGHPKDQMSVEGGRTPEVVGCGLRTMAGMSQTRANGIADRCLPLWKKHVKNIAWLQDIKLIRLKTLTHALSLCFAGNGKIAMGYIPRCNTTVRNVGLDEGTAALMGFAWLCGPDVIYTRLPANWRGRCALVRLVRPYIAIPLADLKNPQGNRERSNIGLKENAAQNNIRGEDTGSQRLNKALNALSSLAIASVKNSTRSRWLHYLDYSQAATAEVTTKAIRSEQDISHHECILTDSRRGCPMASAGICCSFAPGPTPRKGLEQGLEINELLRTIQLNMPTSTKECSSRDQAEEQELFHWSQGRLETICPPAVLLCALNIMILVWCFLQCKKAPRIKRGAQRLARGRSMGKRTAEAFQSDTGI